MDLNGLSGILAGEAVDRSEETANEYARDHSNVPSRRPQAVVRPKDTREVQEIVRWANREKIPLVPVSSGAPHFRGDTVPGMGGVVVDMGRMNRIVRINRRNRVAIVEAGVTFAQLQPEVEKEGMRLAMPLLPRPNKSVVASVLEREPPLMPRYHWDISDPLCCMEVVFGTGDLFRTGEAAGPGGLEGQWRIGGAQKFPLGPHQVDYHRLIQGAQGTMGIVTWASIKCEIMPEIRRPFFVTAQAIEDLHEFTYALLKMGYGDELFLVNHVQLAALSKGSGTGGGAGAILDSLPRWILVFCISGGGTYPEEQVEYLEKDIREIAQRCGVTMENRVGKISSSRILRILGACSPEPYWKLAARGDVRDLLFITTLDRFSPYLETVYRSAAETGIPETHIGVYVQPIVQGTSCHCEFDLYYDPGNPAETARTKELTQRLTSLLVRQGAHFSRPYPAWAREVYARRTGYVGALRKVKSVFDPNHVMNPGKLCF